MTITPIHGDKLPSILYRSFDIREHAQSFMDGYIRFGSSKYYRVIEDSNRRDHTEGIAHFKKLDQYGYEREGFMELTKPVYILSFFTESSFKTALNENRYMVIIQDPFQFANDINQSLLDNSVQCIGGIEHRWVVYDKGSVYIKEPKGPQLARLSWFQKPASYSHEKEYRFCIYLKERQEGTHFIIRLNRRPDYFCLLR